MPIFDRIDRIIRILNINLVNPVNPVGDFGFTQTGYALPLVGSSAAWLKP
jgi:hypothetical protein